MADQPRRGWEKDTRRVNRELSPEYTVTVDFDGRQRRSYQVNATNVLFFDNRFIVPDALIHDGVQTVTITKNGPQRGHKF